MPAIVSPIFVPPLLPLAHILPFAAKQPNGAPSAPMASKPAPNATAGAGRAARPDLAQFVTTVQATAAAAASGWAGNRKAYISHVWRRIEAQCPQWALTPIEFKAMLTAAHAAGRLVLANADLKDASALADVQESAIAFKNTVFHFVRVDD